MYYRLINTLDYKPHATGYNATSINELVDGIYDLLWDEYFEYDLDFIEGHEHKFDTEEKRKNRIKENIKSWNVWVLDIEKRKYPFKYRDLIIQYWDEYYYKDLDKQMGDRFKK
jgi:hypothetical protein